MLNNKIIKKINKHNYKYTKRAFICNLKLVVDYCIHTNNTSFFNDGYKFWARKFHINLNKYESQIKKGINK